MLAAAIHDLRKQSKLTQAQMAEQVGLRQATVSLNLENNPESTNSKRFFKILASLELELHECSEARKN